MGWLWNLRSEQGSRAPFISKLDELNLATTQTREQPARTPNKKRGCDYHGAHPVLTPYTGQPLCASLTDSDLLTPSGKVQTPKGTCHPKLIGHSLRPAAQLRPKIGCHSADSDQTTSNMDPDKGPARCTPTNSIRSRGSRINDNTPDL